MQLPEKGDDQSPTYSEFDQDKSGEIGAVDVDRNDNNPFLVNVPSAEAGKGLALSPSKDRYAEESDN